MSRTIITVTEMASMPGRFEINIKRHGKPQRYLSGARDPGDAAAKALSAAAGEARYVIVGPIKVMSHIPEDVRAA